MTKQEITTKIENIKKGTYITIEYETPMVTKSAFKNETVTKRTRGVFRLGVAYGKMKINQGKEIEGLPYGEWVEGMVNCLIQKGEQYYLRITKSLNKKHKVFNSYFLNGEEINYEDLMAKDMLRKQSPSTSPIRTIKIENIIRIGKGE